MDHLFRLQNPAATTNETHYSVIGTQSGIGNNFTSTGLNGSGVEHGFGLSGLILLSFGAAFSAVLLVFLCIILERRRNNQISAPSATAACSGIETPEERYRNIEKWLVNKRVLAHDEICDKALQGRTFQRKTPVGKSDANRQRTQSVNTTTTEDAEDGLQEEEDNECPICFDTFEPGDIISWSAESCNHCFHHACIKEWLLRNKECPFCREVFLPVDRIQGRMNLKKITELIRAQQQRSARCYYCVCHGVVRPHQFQHCEEIQHRAEAAPDLEELSKLRGVQAEDSNCKDEEFGHPVQSTQDSLSSWSGGSEESTSQLEVVVRNISNDILEQPQGEEATEKDESATPIELISASDETEIHEESSREIDELDF